MKAQNPVSIRAVKVTTIGEDYPEEVTAKMEQNALTGALPTWEEILDVDTPELDTETLFPEFLEDPNSRQLHQITIPLPMDSFGAVLSRMTATQALEYCLAICEREHWKKDYFHILSVLNNLDMEMAY